MGMVELVIPALEKSAKRRRHALLDIEALAQSRPEDATAEQLLDILDAIEARAQSALGGPLAKDAV